MMHRPRFLSLILFSGFLYGHAQSPGGISGGLRGWYKANAGITLSAGFISQWNDQSGNAFNAAQINAGRRPVVNTGAFNYNNTVTFDGTDDYLNMADLMASGATAMSAFAVARQTATNRDIYGCILVGQTNNIGSGGGYGLTSSVSSNTAFGFFVRDFFTNFVSYATTLSTPALMTGIWNGTTANNLQYFHNFVSTGTDPYTPGSVGDNGTSKIGSGVGGGTDYCFYGDIAEIVVYNTGLSFNNANRVASYLAIKYGLTKGSSYVNSAGTPIFQNAGSYTTDIIGIARDDNSDQLQKQSHSEDDSVRIYISSLAATNSANTGSFSADLASVLIGGDGGRHYSRFTEKPAGVYSRIDREWEVNNRGFTGTFNLDIKLSSAALPASVTPSDLRLLVDADGDFSDATIYSSADGLAFSYSNSVVTVAAINTTMVPNNATRYVTLASASASSPLPVELSAFRAYPSGKAVTIEWETLVEIRNHHFELERSGSDADFDWLATVDPRVSGEVVRGLQNYRFLDQSPHPGLNYYRLRQVDLEGTSSISSVIAVDMKPGTARAVRVMTDPANRCFTLSLEGFGGEAVSIALYDDSGQKRWETLLERAENHARVDPDCGNGLNSGLYLCRVTAAATQVTKKVLLW